MSKEDTPTANRAPTSVDVLLGRYTVVARRLGPGISPTLAAAWRRTAEDRLVAAIASGELDWETLHTCSAATDAKRRKARRAAALAASLTPATGPAGTPRVPHRVPATAAS